MPCIAVGSTDGTVHVWEVASGALVCVLPHSKVRAVPGRLSSARRARAPEQRA